MGASIGYSPFFQIECFKESALVLLWEHVVVVRVGVTARKGGVKEAFPSLCCHRNYVYKRTFFINLL